MCGICGLILANDHEQVDLERLVRMRDVIAHRGPDDAGCWHHENVGFGHRRLSIIDLAGGHQPLTNEDQSVWVAFNGEIYNFVALMDELTHRGHCFRTRSDTEVLVHAYEEWGDGFAARLNGMFAFSIYDIKRRRLLLARDHFGIKPLLYAETAEGLFWGSEIKAVLAGAGVKAATTPERVAEYLVFRYVAGAPTFFEGVQCLPPAHYAIWENGRLKTIPYWDPPPAPATHDDLSAVATQLSIRLGGATEAQLISDVPIGAFCSGGLDSGLVTGFAARARRDPMLTFSVGFANRAWDESALAQANARQFGTQHHVITLDSGTFLDTVREAIWHHDEPLSHPNTVPFVNLSRLAREYVKVVLTGEGSDELFAGYPRYHLARLTHAARRLPAPIRRSLATSAGWLPSHKAALVSELLPLSYDDSIIFNSAYSGPDLVSRLTGIAVPLNERRRILGECHVPNDPVASLSRYELRTYLTCLLDRMDRATMAASLEARVPFLDVSLAEWALQLPSDTKLRRVTNKAPVRALAARMLPASVAHARKSGFGLPLGDWLRDDARALVDTLRDPQHPAAKYFDQRELASVLTAFATGAPTSDLVWLLVNVYLWHEVHSA